MQRGIVVRLPAAIDAFEDDTLDEAISGFTAIKLNDG
jgi:hypothetical protein